MVSSTARPLPTHLIKATLSHAMRQRGRGCRYMRYMRHTANYTLKYLNNYTCKHINEAIIKLKLIINTYNFFFL